MTREYGHSCMSQVDILPGARKRCVRALDHPPVEDHVWFEARNVVGRLPWVAYWRDGDTTATIYEAAPVQPMVKVVTLNGGSPWVRQIVLAALDHFDDVKSVSLLFPHSHVIEDVASAVSQSLVALAFPNVEWSYYDIDLVPYGERDRVYIWETGRRPTLIPIAAEGLDG